MPYQSVSIGRIFALRWLTPPDPKDLKALGVELTEARKRAGQALISLSILPDTLAVPDMSIRKDMEHFNKIWADTCDAIHVIVAGEGFKNSIMRSVVSALAIAASKRGLVQVHRTFAEALEKICETEDIDTAQLRLRLMNVKLLDGVP